MNPNTIYRVSIKGLAAKDGKLLLAKEDTGLWELPGGGLEHGEKPTDCLLREIKEETGIEAQVLDKKPVYVWTQEREDKVHRFFVGYKVSFPTLEFTPTDECQEMKYFTVEELKTLPLSPNSIKLPDLFNPEDFS